MINPLFSVLIPTYNRSETLRLAIKSVLRQDFKHFELLILDDASDDRTEEVVSSFRDQRVKYKKNKTNKGVAANVRSGFMWARGSYILTLGDDDMILKPDTLSSVFREMEKRKAGFGKLEVLFFDKDAAKPSSKAGHFSKEIVYLPPSSNILLKTIRWNFGFISGHIFRKDLIVLSDFIDDVWFLYFKIIYRSILKNGCIYFRDHYILARISKKGNIDYMDVRKNQGHHLKRVFTIYKDFDKSSERFGAFERLHIEGVIKSLPAIKYYTSNQNILLIVKELLLNKKRYFLSFFFWFYFLTALITPTFMLGIIRLIQIRLGIRRLRKIVGGIEVEKHVKEIIDNVN